MDRRRWMQAAGGSLLGACSRQTDLPPLQGGWVGAAHERGHLLRASPGSIASLRSLAPVPERRAAVLIVGAGIAGLSAARGFLRAGVDDVHVLELEDGPGGNSRAHRMGGFVCPLGAHYLPLPGDAAHEVRDWLFEIGLLKRSAGRTVADEAHLCHSPQERLFIDGAWHEGLLPPADPASPTMAQYRRFAAAVAAAPRFSIPAHRTLWGDAHRALDAVTFATWLDRERFDDPRLRWYLDYCCRDDYGAGAALVSAWAGLHYFASRHGFAAPGEAQDSDRGAVFTWPEGNAWLADRLAALLTGRLHGARTVLEVQEERHAVRVAARHGDRLERWRAGTVVLATPLAISARILDRPPDALRQAAAATVSSPWLVANVQLDAPLIDRPGHPPAWDSVIYGAGGLGYVDAMHQSLRPHAGATVLTVYQELQIAQRAALLDRPWSAWAQDVIASLAPVHPDLPRRVQRVDLMRYGHAMAVPRPGLAATAEARGALRGGSGRVRFAHADMAGYSIFEEAFIAGADAARAPCRCG